jgi:hypothetical protein
MAARIDGRRIGLLELRICCVGLLTDWIALSVSSCRFCLMRRWFCLLASFRFSTRNTAAGRTAAAAAAAAGRAVSAPSLAMS